MGIALARFRGAFVAINSLKPHVPVKATTRPREKEDNSMSTKVNPIMVLRSNINKLSRTRSRGALVL
jgi:hypothetical protein